jgi:hypothetical protein
MMKNLKEFEYTGNNGNDEESINEALKLLINPLMVRIMSTIGFNYDPKLKQELRDQIQKAVEKVLKENGVIVE